VSSSVRSWPIVLECAWLVMYPHCILTRQVLPCAVRIGPRSIPGLMAIGSAEFARLPFPQKLYQVVNDDDSNHLIRWEGDTA